MAKALKIIGTVIAVVAIAALAVTTFGASLGISAAVISAAGVVSSAAAIAGGVLAVAASFVKPPGFSNGGNPQNFVTNPQSGLPYGIGRSRMSGIRIHADTTDGFTSKPQNDVLGFAVLLCAGGAIQGIDSFYADNFGIGTYAGYMAETTSLGGSTALSLSLGTAAMPGWSSAHKLSGMAHSLWMLRYDSKGDHFQAGVPEPAWIGRWVKVYDPRKDSTYPGGSGAHRALNEATYEWSRNPALHALTWALGRWQNGKRTLGIGAPIANIRVAEFVEAANISDANGWGCGGFSWSTESKWDVLKRMLQASGAVPTMTGAMIGCLVSAPRVSVTTIGSAHLLDSLSIAATKSRRDRFNAVIPRYRSESHEWEVISGTPITNATYETADGGRRTKEIDFPLVQDEIGQAGFNGALQVGQLSAYEIVNSREAGPISFTAGPQFIGLKSGDCVTLDVPEEGLAAQKIILKSVSLDPASGKISFIAETETDAKHAFALGQSTTPPPPFTLTPLPQTPDVPSAAVWTATATASSDGIPSITISGTNEYTTGCDVIIQYRAVGAAEWQAPAVFSDPRGLVRHVIPLLAGAASYEIEVAYRNSISQGGWLHIGPVTTLTNELAASIALAGTTAVVGGGLVDTSGNPVTIGAIRNNLANVDWWRRSATIPWSQYAGNNQMYSTTDVGIAGPKGTPEDIWYAQSQNAAGFGGGWIAAANTAPLDPTLTYRFVVPVWVTASGGFTLFGLSGNVCELNTTTANANPYFTGFDASLIGDRWRLLVGYVYPASSGGKNHDGSGIWDCKTGAKLANGTSYCFAAGVGNVHHRAAQFGAPVGNVRYFGRPIVDVVDGSEPSLDAYFEPGARLNSYVGVNGSGQFVNPVGIGNGTEIGNAWLDLAGDEFGGQARVVLRRANGALVNTVLTLPNAAQNNAITIVNGVVAGIGSGTGAEIDNNVVNHLSEPAGRTFTANHLGVLDALQLPANFQFKQYRGIVDMSASATWAVLSQTGISGGTVTISNGVANIPSGCTIGRTATIQVSATYAGVTRYGKVDLSRQDAAPPTGSSGGGSGSGSTTATDNTLLSVSTITKIAISDEMEVWTGPAGTLNFGGAMDLNVLEGSAFGGFGVKLRWRVKPDGGSYSDVGGADIDDAYPAYSINEGDGYYSSEVGYVEATATKTGLTANAKHFVQLWGARDSASPAKTVAFGGGVSVNGS